MSEEAIQLDMMKQLNNTEYTYKSSHLIESSYELSLTEQRIVSLGCKKIKPIYIEKRVKPSDLENVLTVMKFSGLKISVNEFKKEYNIKANNIYEIIEQATKDLFQRKISYYDEKGVLTDKRWVSTATYDKFDRAIYLTFNPDMILDLLVFKGKYVALFFDMSQNIRSKYAFRLYEILKNYSYLGRYKVSIKDLKFMLAIKEGVYDNYAEFNRRVIKSNIDVINKYSDINVECEPIREGRAITSLIFHITSKTNKTPSIDINFKETIPDSYKEIATPLEKYNIKLSSAEAQMLLETAIESTQKNKIDIAATSLVLEKIDVLEQYVLINDVDNVLGFLRWAIKTNFKMENQTIKSNSKKIKFDNFKGREIMDEKAYEEMLLGHREYDAALIYGYNNID